MAVLNPGHGKTGTGAQGVRPGDTRLGHHPAHPQSRRKGDRR